jgi:hypothetical protein
MVREANFVALYDNVKGVNYGFKIIIFLVIQPFNIDSLA